MSGQIAWPRYLALCVAGLAMIFTGALTALPKNVAIGLAVAGSLFGAMGFRLWMGALLQKHGSGRVLVWLAAVCIVMALLGLLILPKE